jgi:hypothetical protein
VVEVVASKYQVMEVVAGYFRMMVALVVVVECFPLMVEEEVVAERY